MFECFLHNKREVAAFGAIAIIVIAIVAMFFDGIGKHFLRLIDLHTNFGQERQLKRCTIFIYQGFNVNIVEQQVVVIIQVEAFLRKVEGLMYEVGIRIVHLSSLICEGLNKFG